MNWLKTAAVGGLLCITPFAAQAATIYKELTTDDWLIELEEKVEPCDGLGEETYCLKGDQTFMGKPVRVQVFFFDTHFELLKAKVTFIGEAPDFGEVGKFLLQSEFAPVMAANPYLGITDLLEAFVADQSFPNLLATMDQHLTSAQASGTTATFVFMQFGKHLQAGSFEAAMQKSPDEVRVVTAEVSKEETSLSFMTVGTTEKEFNDSPEEKF